LQGAQVQLVRVALVLWVVVALLSPTAPDELMVVVGDRATLVHLLQGAQARLV
jgi:hypothetical protein